MSSASKSSSFGIADRLSALVDLGSAFRYLASSGASSVLDEAYARNAWFTKAEIVRSLRHWGACLRAQSLRQWIAPYRPFTAKTPRQVGILMAGNLPLVGLHDLICVWIAGHKAVIKPSTRDSVLINWVVAHLASKWPADSTWIERPRYLRNIDALIGTGSDETAALMRQYFQHMPQLIRGHRTSAALLTGKEDEKDFYALGEDVFAYFGRGCRSVTQLWLPKGFAIQKIIQAWKPFAAPLMKHTGYANNYAYQRAIALMNKERCIDTGFVLLKEKKTVSSTLESKTSVVFYTFYANSSSLEGLLGMHAKGLQCVVGHCPNGIALKEALRWAPFGCAQYPPLHAYADGIDTLSFLNQIA